MRTLPILIAVIFALGRLGGLAADPPPGLVACSLELDRTILPAEASQRVIARMTLHVAADHAVDNRFPVNIALVIDRSASMKGEKIERVQESVVSVIRALRSSDVFALITYNQSADVLVSAGHVQGREDLVARVAGISAAGDTALFGGLSRGLTELRKFAGPQYVNRLILLSDGKANMGPNRPSEFGRLGASLKKENISVTTIGMGLEYNEDLMIELARNCDGNSYFAAEPGDLHAIFAEELDGLLKTVARNVRLTVRCADNVQPVRLLGGNGRVRGRSVDIAVNQLYAGKSRTFFFELDVSPSPGVSSQAVCSVQATYEGTPQGATHRVAQAVSAQVSDDQRLIGKSVNVEVQRQWNVFGNAMAQNQAIDWADKGDVDEAIQVLNSSFTNIQQLAEQTAAPELDRQARQIEAQIDVLQEQRVYPQGLRKQVRSRNFEDLEMSK